MQTNSPRGRRVRRLLVVGLALVAWAAVSAPSSWAAFGFESWDAGLGGAQADQAGGHADVTTAFTINNHPASNPNSVNEPDGELKTLIASMPAGVLGDPNALPKCSQFDFSNLTQGINPEEGCSAATQVGVVDYTVSGTSIFQAPLRAPVYNMAPRHANEVARLAFFVPVGLSIYVSFQVRTEGDYGIDAVLDGVDPFLPTLGGELTLWANPGDPSHDSQRFPQRVGDGKLFCFSACVGPDPAPLAPLAPGVFAQLRPNPGLPSRPFLANPTRCGEPLVADVSAQSYEQPDTWVTDTHAMDPDGLTGCDLVPFDPSLAVQPRSERVDSPTGVDVEVGLPPSDNPGEPAQSHLRHARVTLPEGLSINPSAADGLQACSDAQLRIGTRLPANCPDASRIGTVEIASPPIPGDGKITGAVYQRPQLPNETFRAVIVAEGHGVNAKIPGVVRPDHQTGQIVGIFEETPQLPFTNMKLSFDGGARAVLATPPRCDTFTTTGVFTPWSGQADAVRTSSFGTSWDGQGAACPASLPFEPTLAAGSRDASAGSSATFVLRARRGDRNQELRSMTVRTPPGLSAYLSRVSVCESAQADAGACPAGSQVGTTLGGAGAGTHPFYLPGKVFLSEGYKGGDYGLSIVVPAKAGPFDLGDVTVRAAIHVDRDTAAITVVSDPIPRIIEGVPLRIRDIRVALDREGFARNPTSCERQEIAATFGSYGGATATRTTPMRMRDCRALGFRPRMAMRLLGPRQRRTGGHPAVRALVRQRAAGQSAIERVQVRLPRSIALDPANANGLCEFEDGQRDDLENHCPRSSIVGRAVARSPLLNRPLRGPVFFVKNVRIDPDTGNEIRTLPTIVMALRGEIAINVRSNTNARRGKLITTFPRLPDAPISRFRLALKGGNSGILVVTRTPRGEIDLCDRRQVMEADMDGHNGRKFDRDIRLRTPCRRARRGASAKRRKAAAKRRAAARRARPGVRAAG